MPQPSQKALDLLKANPDKWQDFKEKFGSLPDGFAPPAAPQRALDLLAANPDKIGDFEAKFGYRPKAPAPPVASSPVQPAEADNGPDLDPETGAPLTDRGANIAAAVNAKAPQLNQVASPSDLFESARAGIADSIVGLQRNALEADQIKATSGGDMRARNAAYEASAGTADPLPEPTGKREDAYFYGTAAQRRALQSDPEFVASQQKLDELEATSRGIQKEQGDLAARNPSLIGRSSLSAAGSMIPSMGAMAVGLATGSPVAAAASMMPGTFGSTNNSLRNAGVEHEKAERGSTISAGLEGATELLPFTALLKKDKSAVSKIAHTLVAELPGESIATVTQTLNEYLHKQPDDITFGDVVTGLKQGASELPETWLSTLMTVGAQSGLVHAAQSAAKPRGRKGAAIGLATDGLEALDEETRRDLETHLVQQDALTASALSNEVRPSHFWDGIAAEMVPAGSDSPGVVIAQRAYASAYGRALAATSDKKMPQSLAIKYAQRQAETAANNVTNLTAGLIEGSATDNARVRAALSELPEGTLESIPAYKAAAEKTDNPEEALHEAFQDPGFAYAVAHGALNGLDGKALDQFIRQQTGAPSLAVPVAAPEASKPEVAATPATETAKVAEAPKAPALSETDTKRLGQLEQVATSAPIEPADFQGLVDAGLAKTTVAGKALLTPKGRRARVELQTKQAKATAAQEVALKAKAEPKVETTAKVVEKPAAAPAEKVAPAPKKAPTLSLKPDRKAARAEKVTEEIAKELQKDSEFSKRESQEKKRAAALERQKAADVKRAAKERADAEVEKAKFAPGVDEPNTSAIEEAVAVAKGKSTAERAATEKQQADEMTEISDLEAVVAGESTAGQVGRLSARGLVSKNNDGTGKLLPAGRRRMLELRKVPARSEKNETRKAQKAGKVRVEESEAGFTIISPTGEPVTTVQTRSAADELVADLKTETVKAKPRKRAAKPKGTLRTKSGEPILAGATKEDAKGTDAEFARSVPEAPPTKSSAFKRWFGKSQVVNEDGSPKRMYQGSNTRLLDSTPLRNGVRNGMLFVTDDTAWAAKYSSQNGGRILPLFVKAENIFDIHNPEHSAQLIRELQSLGEGLTVKHSLEDLRLLLDDKSLETWNALERDLVSSTIRKLGFDAMRITETSYEPSDPRPRTGTLRTGLAIFDRTQLKSAIGNNGEFDPSNIDITRSVGEPNPSKGIARTELDKVVTAIGVELNVRIRIADSDTDPNIPTYIRDELAKVAGTQGLFYKSPTGETEVWLIRENLADRKTAIEVAIHESVGHLGLRAMLGPKRYNATMRQIRKSFPREVRSRALRNQIKWDSKNRDVQERRRNLAAEELVAYATARSLTLKPNARSLSVWDRIADFFRNAARSAGLLKSFSVKDVDRLILRARDYVRDSMDAGFNAQSEYEGEMVAAQVANPKMQFKHFSNLTEEEVELNPAFQGTGFKGRESVRKGPQVTSLYPADLSDAEVEKELQGKTKYVVEVPEQLMYDASEDKLGLRQKAQKAVGWTEEDGVRVPNRFIFDMNRFEELIREAGFTGYHTPAANGILRGQGRLFNPIRARRANDAAARVDSGVTHFVNGNIHTVSMEGGASMTAEAMPERGMLWVKSANVPEDKRGAGLGVAMAQRLVTEAYEMGLQLVSDNRVSDNAARVYDSLARRGYSVKRNPARIDRGTGELISASELRPVFEVTGGELAASVGLADKSLLPGDVYLNVGLAVPGGGTLTADAVRDAVAATGANIVEDSVQQSDTEQTVVMRLTKKLTAAQAKKLSTDLKQDAVAQFSKGKGELFGPKAKEWGPFNPKFFLMLDGTRAAEIKKPSASKVAAQKTIRKVAPFLTPAERTSVNQSTAKKLVDLFDSLPSEKDLAAAAIAGQAKRGWYRKSAEAIVNIFGPDSARFAALLAALSPQTSVEMNLTNTVRTWANWVKAGRPTEREAIIKVMGDSVVGSKAGDSILPAWINNTVRALSSEEPESIALSGPKVDSFAANLRGETNAVTLDTWMANFALVEQKIFGGTMSKAGVSGKRFGYLAYSARVRQAAQYLSEKTGETWTPAEVQETVWSWAKALYEYTDSFGALGNAQEIVESEELTDALINATPDFATLFRNSEYEKTLRDAGYGEQLDGLAGTEAESDQRADQGQKIAALEGDRKRLSEAAARLDKLRESRREQKSSSTESDEESDVEEEADIAYAILPGNTGDPVLDSFLDKFEAPGKTLRQHWQNWTAGIVGRSEEEALDDLAGIKNTAEVAGIDITDSGFKNAHLARSAAELTTAVLEHGPPIWIKEGTHELAGVESQKLSFLQILKPLGSNVDLWGRYMVAKRAKALKAQGRENLFTDAEIAKGLALGVGHPEFDVAATAYAALNKQVLDFAEYAGRIDPAARALWENQNYIPFYRVSDAMANRGGSVFGPLGNLSKAIQQLRGGKANLGDPIENIVKNWYSLLDGALKAHAARTVVDAFDGTGLVVREPMMLAPVIVPMAQVKQWMQQNPRVAALLYANGIDVQLLPASAFAGIQQMFAVQPPSDPEVVNVWRNGKREYWRVNDEPLLRGLMSIPYTTWGPWMEIFRLPKRIFTATTTSTPQFQFFSNPVRDMFHSFVVGAVGRNTTVVPVLDTAKGILSQLKQDQDAVDLLAAGGSFTHGYVSGGQDKSAAASYIRRTLKQRTAAGKILNTPAQLWRMYRELGNAFENSNRVSIYKNMRKAGASRLDAAYEARDVLDFSKRGANGFIRFLVESAPFWNARIQGLYRIGRSPGGKKKVMTGLVIRGMLLSTITLGLGFLFGNDDRYKELTSADKALYWHFWLGDKHFKIPKPFEVGSIFGTGAEAIMDYFVANAKEPDRAKQAASLIGFAATQSMNLTPDIQAVQPLVDLWRNKDTFSESPILNTRDLSVLPSEQDSPSVHSTYRLLSHLAPVLGPDAFESPKQLQYLGKHYIGGIQDYILTASDMLARRALGEPEPAAPGGSDIPGLRTIVTYGPPRSTKYTSTMYTIADQAAKLSASIAAATELSSDYGDKRVEKLETDNPALLDVAEDFKKALKQVRKLQSDQRDVQLDPAMTPDQKREALDESQSDINDIARGLYNLRPGGLLNPETASLLIGAPEKEQIRLLEKEGLPATARLLREYKVA